LWHLKPVLEKAGYDVTLCDLALQRDIPEADAYGITGTTVHASYIKRVMKHLKEEHPKAYFIAGGAHASVMPEEVFCWGFDCVVSGEAEEVIADAIRDRHYGILRPQRVKNLDAFPFADRSQASLYKYRIAGKPATTIMSSRGCPHGCAFCSKAVWGRRTIMRSAGHVIEELKELKRAGWNAVMFFDDTMGVNKVRLTEIAYALKRLEITYRLFLRSSDVDRKLAHVLAKTGCHEVGIGVESGSDKILASIHKGETIAEQRQGIETLRSEGVRVKGFLIVGLPGESRETLAETEAFLRDVPMDDHDFSLLSIFPGSGIHAHPEDYDVKWDAVGTFYKGRPTQYMSSVRTSALNQIELMEARDKLEQTFKPSLWEHMKAEAIV